MKLIINLSQDPLMAKLAAYPDRVVRSVVKALDGLTIAMQSRVKQKLSGEVLHVRSGTLRRSINREVRNAGSGMVDGIVGTNVEYAGVHEYGFHGTVTVKEHLRRVRTQGKVALLWDPSRHGGMGEWRRRRGRLTGEMATVHEHQREMNMPERSFLRSTLREFEPKIREELRFAMLEALHS